MNIGNWEEKMKSCPHEEKDQILKEKLFIFNNPYNLFICRNCGVAIWIPIKQEIKQ